MKRKWIVIFSLRDLYQEWRNTEVNGVLESDVYSNLEYTFLILLYIWGAGVAQSVGYGLGDRDSIPGKGRNFIHLATVSRRALRTTQPPIQYIPGALSLRVKRPDLRLWPRLIMSGAIHPLPPHVFIAWHLVKRKELILICLKCIIFLPLKWTVNKKLLIVR
jgi:hypothetical protein